MSIKLMSAVFDLRDVDSAERLVMLALADHADDQGRCYPSIRRLCERTSMSDRGIQKVLGRLSERGYLEVDANAGQGGANLYIVSTTPEPGSPPNDVHPRTLFTPPPNPVRHRGEPGSPKPSRTTKEPPVTRDVRAVLCSILPESAADDWIAHRKAKRAKLTVRAADLMVAKLKGHPDPVSVIQQSILNGWTGIFPENGKTAPRTAGVHTDFWTGPML